MARRHRLPYCERMAFDPTDVPAFVAFVRAEAQGVVATVSPSGAPEAALVGIAALDDGTLVFDTLIGSRKAENLRHDHRIAMVVGTDGSVSAQIDGFATIVHGTLREEYGGAYNAQFPGSRALDPQFAVVVVRPAWVRVYDASTPSAVITEVRW
jgi:general stress protein 26